MKAGTRFAKVATSIAVAGLFMTAGAVVAPSAQAQSHVHNWQGITIVGRVIDTNSGDKTIIVRSHHTEYTVSNRRNAHVRVGDRVRVVGQWTGRRIVRADIDRI